MRIKSILILVASLAIFASACKKKEMPEDPDTAPEVSVDRFSDAAATLMKRSENPGLPAADDPINYDQGAPFITKGLGPDGQMVEYYNFDVQPTEPAPIYVLFSEGESSPVPDQLNIIDVIPGDNGYNDFWHLHKVTVPEAYEANVVTSLQEIMDKGYDIEATETLVNCPVVPEGSSASKRMGGGNSDLIRGWYKDQVVYYFSFEEKALTRTANDMVPLSPIYVTFNVNPDPNDPNSGPPSGFMSEQGNMQTHNVVATIPSDNSYSPLWMVNVYDNADFSNVSNLSTAQSANILATGVANVNCPIVSVQ
jgi:hypothetical protein